ncbi:hypothetical protein DUNSADRAFT_15467 [Dunaliella salina]|uniref:Encoded protein n=1 Tax=Dunaliella salina TaxID=3046 RepID=A0ABQ7G5B7_DUNSA|nr:hypothetical protein DUNSADRAFT_15467 [Dunaliella salina]|eukprot:KAF5829803.1 hypothetical protein DUNSADRAFT_15467 [Dunaliella salina]
MEGVSVIDASGTATATVKLTNERLAKYIDGLDKDTKESRLQTALRGEWTLGDKLTVGKVEVDGNTVAIDLFIDINSATNDIAAEIEVMEYIKSLKGDSQAVTDLVGMEINGLADYKVSKDDIDSINDGAAVRMGLGAVVCIVLSMFMLT